VRAFRILACLLASCWIAPGLARGEDASKEITNSMGMKLVLIPAGKFIMGSPVTEVEREAGEDQHEVAITRPFYLGVHTVTQGQFEKVMGKRSGRPSSPQEGPIASCKTRGRRSPPGCPGCRRSSDGRTTGQDVAMHVVQAPAFGE
jgi:formylglycine-generating enzyme required for sulfatase activity